VTSKLEAAAGRAGSPRAPAAADQKLEIPPICGESDAQA
jgi:hypothetical protein